MNKQRLYRFLEIDPNTSIFWFQTSCMVTAFVGTILVEFIFFENRPIISLEITDWMLSFIPPIMSFLFAGQAASYSKDTFFPYIASNNKFLMIFFGFIFCIAFFFLSFFLFSLAAEFWGISQMQTWGVSGLQESSGDNLLFH